MKEKITILNNLKNYFKKMRIKKKFFAISLAFAIAFIYF